MILNGIQKNNMKKEYDFSKAERGTFYNEKARLNIPVYLDSDIQAFVDTIAESKNRDVSAVVDELLKKDMDIAEMTR